MRNTVRMVNPRDRWIAWMCVTRDTSIPFSLFLSPSLFVSLCLFPSVFSICYLHSFLFVTTFTSSLFFPEFISQFYTAFARIEQTVSPPWSRYLIRGITIQKHGAEGCTGRGSSGAWRRIASFLPLLPVCQQVCEFLGTQFVYFPWCIPNYTRYGYVTLNKPAFYCGLHIVGKEG